MVNSFWFKFALSIEEVNLITKKHVNETDFTVDIEREPVVFIDYFELSSLLSKPHTTLKIRMILIYVLKRFGGKVMNNVQ